MHVAVGLVAGTAIRGAAATVMMRSVLQRHPDAFLITLANYGVTLSMAASQERIRNDIVKELRVRGRAADSPIVLVGHSQGGLAVLRYAVDHPLQVKHVFSVGAPWQGSVSAGRLARITGARLPAIRDMSRGSEFLTALHADLPTIADRVSNIYSTHEVFIRPYVHAHIDVPGVTNTLIATDEELAHHLRDYPEYELDDVILQKGSHLSEMQLPEVRARVWRKVDELVAEYEAGAQEFSQKAKQAAEPAKPASRLRSRTTRSRGTPRRASRPPAQQ